MSLVTSLFFCFIQSSKILAALDLVAPWAAPHTQLVQLGHGLIGGVGGGTEVFVRGLGGECLRGGLRLWLLLLHPEVDAAGVRLGVRGPGLLFSQSVEVAEDQPLSLRRLS